MKKSHLARVLWAVLALGTGTAFSQTPRSAQEPDPFSKIAAKPAQPAVEGGIPVEVVDQAGEPLAGVAVVAITTEDLQSPEAMAFQMERAGASVTDPAFLMAGLAALIGKKFVTDENGRTSVTYANGGVVIAFRDRQVSYHVLEPPFPTEDKPIRLAFVPPLEFEVEVVDAQRQPAKDVPIGIGPRRDSMGRYVSQAQTDGEGRAHLAIRRDSLQGSPKVFVELLVPLRVPIYREIELAEMESAPIRFELPPTGQVRVIVYDEQDRPRQDVQSIMIRKSLDPNSRSAFAFMDLRQPMYAPTILEEDNAIFSHVGLGLEFEATVVLRGIEGSLGGEGTGPTRPRELTVIPVRAVEGPPVLTLRIRDARGRPVANEVVGMAIRTERNFLGTVPSTNAEGVLRITLDEDSIGDNVYLTILRRGPGPTSAYRGAARIYLSRRDRPWENPVTDLVVEEEPVLVSGRVVDTDGKPLSGVAVHSRLAAASGAGGRSFSGRGGFFEHRVETDEQGLFTIRELHTDAPTIPLQVTGDGYAVVSSTEFAPRTRDARIVLARAGRVHGSFAEAPPEALSGINVRLVSEDGPAPGWMGIRRNGSFTLDRVIPGSHSLEVRLNSEEPVLVVPDLVAEAGQDLRDPRIQDIDWRAFARVVTIKVLDERSRSLPHIQTMLYQQTKNGGWSGVGHSTNDEGTVEYLIARERPANLEIKSPDHLIVRMENLIENQDVVLQPRPVLEVSLKGELELPEDIRLVGSLSLRNTMPAQDHWGSISSLGMDPFAEDPGYFNEHGVARIPLPTTEPLRLSIGGRIATRGFATRFAAIPSIAEDIVIDPESGPQRIEIELTDEHRRELQRAIERIRRLR